MKFYLIYRAGEYFGEKGFWALNVENPHYYHARETAEHTLNDFHPFEQEGCEIVEIELDLN